MVRNVAARTPGIVALQPAQQLALAAAHRLPALAAVLPPIGPDEHLEQIEDRPVLDDQPPVHVGFAEVQPRVAGDIEGHLAVGEADGEMLVPAGPIRPRRLAGQEQGNAARLQ